MLKLLHFSNLHTKYFGSVEVPEKVELGNLDKLDLSRILLHLGEA